MEFKEWKAKVKSGDLCADCSDVGQLGCEDKSSCCQADLDSELLECAYKAGVKHQGSDKNKATTKNKDLCGIIDKESIQKGEKDDFKSKKTNN